MVYDSFYFNPCGYGQGLTFNGTECNGIKGLGPVIVYVYGCGSGVK